MALSPEAESGIIKLGKSSVRMAKAMETIAESLSITAGPDDSCYKQEARDSQRDSDVRDAHARVAAANHSSGVRYVLVEGAVLKQIAHLVQPECGLENWEYSDKFILRKKSDGRFTLELPLHPYHNIGNA